MALSDFKCITNTIKSKYYIKHFSLNPTETTK
jgi:hypothetical protein